MKNAQNIISGKPLVKKGNRITPHRLNSTCSHEIGTVSSHMGNVKRAQKSYQYCLFRDRVLE